MHISNAVVVDNTQQFGLLNTIDSLGLLIMIHQHYTFWPRIDEISA